MSISSIDFLGVISSVGVFDRSDIRLLLRVEVSIRVIPDTVVGLAERDLTATIEKLNYWCSDISYLHCTYSIHITVTI